MVQVNGQAPAQSSGTKLPLDTALDIYEQALLTLEDTVPNSTFAQKVAVLVARDGVEKKKQMDQNPLGATYARLLSLDERLKAQAKILSEDDELAQWKDSLNAPPNMWWWHLKYPLAMSPMQVAKRYKQAISALEVALPHASKEQVLEVLLARDAIETSRDNQPLPEHIAKIVIDLDERLRSLADIITQLVKLEDWKKSLSKTTPNMWWWELSNIEPIPVQAVERYEKALVALELPPKPTSEELLEVLLGRDAVEKAWIKQQQPPRYLTAKIIELDKRLKAQSQAFANDDIVDEWKNNLKPPEMNWWWSFTRSVPLPNEAIARYEKTINVVESNKPPASEQLLEALLARDGVEEAVEQAYRSKPVPEKLARQIIALDNKLKQYRLDLNKDNQIRQWKDSLKRQNRWWWELKPAIVGSEEEPGTRKDWLFNTLAVICLGIGAAFTAYSSQVFFQKVEGQETQQADLSQNMAAVLQVIGLGAGGAAALTSGGRKTLEKLFTNLQLPPNKQAPTALAIAAGMAAVTGTVAASLPLWGKAYINQGEQHLQNGDWLKAEDSFLQAKKFISADEDKAKIELGFGSIYEHLGDVNKAKESYKKAAALDNMEGMGQFARLSIIDFFLKNPPGSRMKPSASDDNYRQAKIYNDRVSNKLAAEVVQSDAKEASNENLKIKVIAQTNQVILYLLKEMIIDPKNPDVIQNKEIRFNQLKTEIPSLFSGNAGTLEKLPEDNSIRVRNVCLGRGIMQDLQAIGVNIPDEQYKAIVPTLYDRPSQTICYNDKTLSILDFSLIEGVADLARTRQFTITAIPPKISQEPQLGVQGQEQAENQNFLNTP